MVEEKRFGKKTHQMLRMIFVVWRIEKRSCVRVNERVRDTKSNEQREKKSESIGDEGDKIGEAL